MTNVWRQYQGFWVDEDYNEHRDECPTPEAERDIGLQHEAQCDSSGKKEGCLEFAVADVLSECASSGTRFTPDESSSHSYHGQLWNFKSVNYRIQILGPKNLDLKYRKLDSLTIIAACNISSGTDVPNSELEEQAKIELAKFEESRPQIYLGSLIRLVFLKEKPAKLGYFLYSMGSADPGNDEPNVKSVEVLN